MRELARGLELFESQNLAKNSALLHRPKAVKYGLQTRMTTSMMQLLGRTCQRQLRSLDRFPRLTRFATIAEEPQSKGQLVRKVVGRSRDAANGEVGHITANPREAIVFIDST